MHVLALFTCYQMREAACAVCLQYSQGPPNVSANGKDIILVLNVW